MKRVLLFTALCSFLISGSLQGAVPYPGGSNFGWYDVTPDPATGQLVSDYFGVIARYHEPGPKAIIDGRLQDMFNNGQRTIRLLVFHARLTDEYQTVGGQSLTLNSTGGVFHSQNITNIVNVVTKMRDIGFQRVQVAFMPSHENNPFPCEGEPGVYPCYWRNTVDWVGPSTKWTEGPIGSNTHEGIKEENFSVIWQVMYALRSSPGVPRIDIISDLGNELSPLVTYDPNNFDPATGRYRLKDIFADTTYGLLSEYVKRLWTRYSWSFGNGQTVGFSSPAGYSALESQIVAYEASGRGIPEIFDVHLYDNPPQRYSDYCSPRPPEAPPCYGSGTDINVYVTYSAYDTLWSTAQMIQRRGHAWQSFFVGESWYNDGPTGSGLRSALNAGAPVTFIGITQWPRDRIDPNTRLAATPLFSNYIAYGF